MTTNITGHEKICTLWTVTRYAFVSDLTDISFFSVCFFSSEGSSPTARTPPHFTVKRTLNLKNTGQIALHVNSWYINGQQCEGYGFRVLQCEPLFVQPNSTARLDIT